MAALLAVGSGACEEPRPVGGDEPEPDCVGKCDGGVTGAVPVAIRSASWDGRIAFGSMTGDDDCRVMAVRPGLIDRSDAGVSFAPSVFSDGVACPAPLGALAVASAELPENPFPADAAGTPTLGGDHRGYALQIVAADDEDQLVLRQALAVVAQPGSDEAEVISIGWDAGAVMLDVDAQPLVGAEPTVTADGRLLVFRDGDALVYARADAGTWTRPRPLTDLFLEADVDVDGLTLAQRYPLAATQLRGPDGRFLPPGSAYFGAHPWLSPDGTELLHTATVSELTGERDGAVSVIGQATGHGLRHVDGPINPSRDATSGRMTSPGRSRGLYAPYPEARTLPTIGHAPAYPVFGELGTYHEVDFEVFADRDYLLYLPMNENIATAGDFVIDVGHTPDLSGHFNTATVEAGASFLVDLDPEQDGNAGALGRAVFFSDDGVVRVPEDSTLPVPRWGLSTALFVQRLAEAEGSRPLLQWPGVLALHLEADGRVRASVVVGEAVHEATTTAAIAVGEWTHVAMTYDGRRGSMALYVAGVPAGTGAFAPGMPLVASGDLLIGPAGGAEVPVGELVLGLDEVSISQIVRTRDEIFTAATGQPAPSMPLGGEELLMGTALPTGLDARDLQIPAWAPLRPEVVELGQLIFFDTRLSRNGQVSCATCHDPQLAFTDGRATALAIDGTDLPRATPTVFNRAMSMSQFWDARSRTLESQALSPIGAPREMNFTIEEAVALMASSQEYVDGFLAAFGRAPDRNGIANAIAAFERAQLAGNSPVDRFEAGELDALTEAEQRGRALFHGKARCVACHGGSNYTDERLHDVGLLSDNDLGAFFTSGGRLANARAFKTPTLRNIDITGPYFHDGSVETLEEVVALYNAGPLGAGHDWESRALGLTPEEEADLVAFLRALTSPNAVQDLD